MWKTKSEVADVCGHQRLAEVDPTGADVKVVV